MPCFLHFLLFGSFARACSQQGSFALTLTPTAIVASRVNVSSLVKATQLPITPEYRKYLEDAVLNYGRRIEVRVNEWHIEDGALVSAPPDTHDESAARSMFCTAISTVTQNMSDALGYHPIHSSLFLPAIFNQSAMRAVHRAVFTAADDERVLKTGYGWQAACEAYQFFTPPHCVEYLGRAQEECNDDGPHHSIIVLEYEESFVQASLVDLVFAWEGCGTSHQMFCRECGYGLERELGAQAHRQRLNIFLGEFIESGLRRSRSINGFRALVVAGEAPKAAVAQIESLIRQLIKTDHFRILNDIDHVGVVAHGAALFAMDTQKNPASYTVHRPKILEIRSTTKCSARPDCIS